MAKPVILTGLRSNNDLHIGNYFGALLPLIDMARHRSEKYDVQLFVPDLHSFTTPIDHDSLFANSIHNLKLFVASGLPLDKDGVFIYRQSFVPAHSELSWILDCFTGFGELQRMTQFKDKSKQLGGDRVTVGLFNYPVLMAADILLYKAVYVPVGDDQSQHLEFVRDIAIRMNHRFGELFVVPKPVAEQHRFFGEDQGLRIKDLLEPTKKMSKSDDSGKGVIFLSDKPEEAAHKIMAATTDSIGAIHYDPEAQPGISNLLQILALLSKRDLKEVTTEWQGQTKYGEFKQVVAEAAKQFLLSFQSRFQSIDESLLQLKLAHDEATMNERANDTLLQVQQAVGLRALL